MPSGRMTFTHIRRGQEAQTNEFKLIIPIWPLLIRMCTEKHYVCVSKAFLGKRDVRADDKAGPVGI